MKQLTGVFIVGMLAFMMSCGGETVVEPLEEGWTLWENGAYAEAYAKFAEAGGPEGLNGLGWTTLKMDSMEKSEAYFALAIEDGGVDTLIDAAAGLAITGWQQGDYAISLDATRYVMRKDANYAFTHDASVDKGVILRAKGYDEYHLGQYSACIATIQILDNTFSANANDPNIATILLNKLNALSGTGS
jgi:hypothetical protein